MIQVFQYPHETLMQISTEWKTEDSIEGYDDIEKFENDWIVFLRGNNLTNELAYSATTVEEIRYFNPLPGRSAFLGLKKYF